MTREEQRLLRETEKQLKKTCKELGRRRGWKTIAGTQYQVRGEILYELMVFLRDRAGGGMDLMSWCSCKPLALDDIFWKVFHMEEIAASQPFSFHVRGAFTARSLALDKRREPLPGPEALGEMTEALFDRAEALAAENPFPDLAAFRARLEAEERPQVLGIILCLLGEGNYSRAMELIEENLARGERGGFSREGGRRSVLEDARDYCAARLAETV